MQKIRFNPDHKFADISRCFYASFKKETNLDYALNVASLESYVRGIVCPKNILNERRFNKRRVWAMGKSCYFAPYGIVYVVS